MKKNKNSRRNLRSVFDAMHSFKGKSYTSIKDILADMNADFTVRKLNVELVLENGKRIPWPKHVGIVKDDDTALALVGVDYGISQYEKCFGLVEELLKGAVGRDASGPQVELIAGQVVGLGEKVYLVLRAGNNMELSLGDTIENYFVMRSSHDGSKHIEVQITPYRKVNGTILATPSRPFSFKHGAKVEDRIVASKITLRNVVSEWNKLTAKFKELTQIKVTDDQAVVFFETVIGESQSARATNIKDDLFMKWKRTGISAKLPSCAGTLFGCYAQVCEWADHYRTTRKPKWIDPVSAELLSKLEADGARKKVQALSVAFKMQQALGDNV